jgi:hypothetical protein
LAAVTARACSTAPCQPRSLYPVGPSVILDNEAKRSLGCGLDLGGRCGLGREQRPRMVRAGPLSQWWAVCSGASDARRSGPPGHGPWAALGWNGLGPAVGLEGEIWVPVRQVTVALVEGGDHDRITCPCPAAVAVLEHDEAPSVRTWWEPESGRPVLVGNRPLVRCVFATHDSPPAVSSPTTSSLTYTKRPRSMDDPRLSRGTDQSGVASRIPVVGALVLLSGGGRAWVTPGWSEGDNRGSLVSHIGRRGLGVTQQRLSNRHDVTHDPGAGATPGCSGRINRGSPLSYRS